MKEAQKSGKTSELGLLHGIPISFKEHVFICILWLSLNRLMKKEDLAQLDAHI